MEDIKEIKYAQARIEGKNKTESAMIATGTTKKTTANAYSQRLEKSPTVIRMRQTAMQKALKKYKISIDKIIKPIADALEADKVILDKETGELLRSPDHAVRLKASDMAMKLLKEHKEPEKPKNDNNDLIDAINSNDEVELQKVIFRKNT